ncbi:hypothetical protein D3C84_652930 [compost metagenome]
MVPRLAVSTCPKVGVVSLITGAPVGASLDWVAETRAVTSDRTVSSTPLASL